MFTFNYFLKYPFYSMQMGICQTAEERLVNIKAIKIFSVPREQNVCSGSHLSERQLQIIFISFTSLYFTKFLS